MSKTFVIVNPKSRSGDVGRRLADIERLLAHHLREHQLLVTQREGDGERLANEAVRAGATQVVVVGGDGTVSEVVSGLFASGGAHVELAIVPRGSGGDLARLLGLSRDPEVALARLARGRKRVIDVGKLTCLGPHDQPRVRWFLNIASFGMSGEAMLWLAEQGRRGKRNALSYMESGMRGLFAYGSPPVRVRLDGELVHEGKLLLGVVANGQYFGAGMHVAPDARIDDGQFDLMLAGDFSKLSALALFPRFIFGRHLSHPLVRMHRGRVVEVESEAPGERIWLEADGEAVGRLPARLELLPAALTLCGLP